MADIKIVKEWITFADEDFEFASIILDDKDKFYSKICFHLQQAGEKYIKAYIVGFDLGLKKIHNLRTLMEICAKKDNSFEELREDCIFLNAFYIDTRYPAFYPVGATKDDAEKARQAAKRIGNFVKEKLIK